MMQFIISPKRCTAGLQTTILTAASVYPPFSLSCYIPPTQHSSMHLLSTIVFGTFRQFHRPVRSKQFRPAPPTPPPQGDEVIQEETSVRGKDLQVLVRLMLTVPGWCRNDQCVSVCQYAAAWSLQDHAPFNCARL